MARKLRVQYPGAIYHVMNRGDHSEIVFRDLQTPMEWGWCPVSPKELNPMNTIDRGESNH